MGIRAALGASRLQIVARSREGMLAGVGLVLARELAGVTRLFVDLLYACGVRRAHDRDRACLLAPHGPGLPFRRAAPHASRPSSRWSGVRRPRAAIVTRPYRGAAHGPTSGLPAFVSGPNFP